MQLWVTAPVAVAVATPHFVTTSAVTAVSACCGLLVVTTNRSLSPPLSLSHTLDLSFSLQRAFVARLALVAKALATVVRVPQTVSVAAARVVARWTLLVTFEQHTKSRQQRSLLCTMTL